jgi:hypothetical protein
LQQKVLLLKLDFSTFFVGLNAISRHHLLLCGMCTWGRLEISFGKLTAAARQ